jgi:predicted ester cyclase
MARGNSDVVLAIADAFNRRDIDALMPLLDEGVEHRDVRRSTALRGRREMRQHFVELWGESPEASFRVDEILEDGDWVIVRQTWRGLAGGQLTTWVARRFVNGKVRRIEVYTAREEALEAAGLRQ